MLAFEIVANFDFKFTIILLNWVNLLEFNKILIELTLSTLSRISILVSVHIFIFQIPKTFGL